MKLTSALFVLFLGLKLCHVIDWAWIWVCAPLWIPLALVLAILFLYGILWTAITGFVALIITIVTGDKK